jgi:hypothetical protein
LPIGELLRILQPLAYLDRAVLRSQKRSAATAMAAFFATIITFIVLAANGFNAWLAPLPIVSLLTAVVSASRSRRLRKLTLAQKLPRVVVPLLAVLREEVDAGTPVTLELDLRPATLPEKLTGTESLPDHPPFYKVSARLFRDAWMTGRCQLDNGARLAWSVTSEVREINRRKRTPGKTKFQTKVKNRNLLTVSVALPKDSFAFADPTGDAAGRGQGQVKVGDKRDTLTLTRVVKTDSADPADAAQLLDTMADAFRRARAVGKAVGA